MKNLKVRVTSILLILILLLSAVVPVFAIEASIPTQYSKDYNSGQRDVVCTTLDGTSAASYYSQNYNYDTLSEMSDSQLFNSLQTLMRSTHSYTSSYDDCHYKADRTDCQNKDGSVSLIYTSYSATMNQWNGWNREHVWPKSLGGDSTTGGGADLHHIRPSDSGVNSSRGNKPYGESGSNPSEKKGTDPAVGVLGGTYNSEYFEPLDNVKGDVARICLYVYVRWNSEWGATDITDVFESVDVLLEWCELDPVDTWEMGRNEVVEDIQGNRNVFIDYPEYAWQIFGREAPDDMVTPSGEASGGNSSGDSTGGGSTGGTTEPDTPVIPDTPDAPETPVGDSATLSFASKSQRTSFSTQQQIWEQNGIKFTNDKKSSSNNVADYAGPVRLYQNSSITIEAQENIAKIEFTCNSSSYATVLKNSIGSEAAVNGSVVTVTPSSSAKSFNISSLTAQTRLESLTVYYESEPEPEPEPECEHSNTTTTTKPATCTVAGATTIKCDDCGATLSTTPIPATGHLSTTETTTKATCDNTGSIIKKCDDCGATVSSESIPALGHDYVDDVCVRCGDTIEYVPSTPTSGSWILVTDASELKAGDRIVIVSGTFVAGNITSQYMSKVEGLSISENTITELPSGAVILTLGGNAGAWTLSNDSGKKLGATTVKKLAWDSGTTTWSISISTSGAATIQNGTSTYGRFLYNVSSPRFTTYTSNTSSSMLLPQIYKYEETPAESEEVVIKSASMTVGSTLALNYYVSGYDKNTAYYMIFTMNGVQSERIIGTEKNGYLVFTYTNIAPHFMGDNISAALYAEGSTLPCSILDRFSVKEYAERVMATHSNNEKLLDLVADMLRYGAKAQEYRGYKIDNLVTDGLDLSGKGSDYKLCDEDNCRALETHSDISTDTDSFTSAGVRFDFDNKIFVKFKASDLLEVKIVVNGDDLSNKIEYLDGVYVLYTDGILATEFDKVFTFDMYISGTLHQTVTYSVNSYAYAKNDDNTVIGQLALALYRYGASAKSYLG